MVHIILLVLMTSLIGGFNPNLRLLRTSRKEYFRGWLKRFLIGLIPAWIQFYVFMPAMVGPLHGLGKVLFQFWAVNIFLTWTANFKASPQVYRGIVRETFPTGAYIIPGFGLVLGVCWIFSAPMFNANRYAALLGEVSQEDPSSIVPVSLEQFRPVSESYADFLGKRALTDALSSSFHIGTWSLNRVKGQLYWIAPLEFNKGRNYFAEGSTPGYIQVSATNPRDVGHLVKEVDGRSVALHYLLSSWTTERLDRRLYVEGFYNYVLEDPRFELDDSFMPHWVIPLSRPSVGWSCPIVEKVALVNACDGSIALYEPATLPAWVDGAYSASLISRYIEWWGYYHQGYVSSVLKSAGLKSLDGGLYRAWGDDGTPYYFGVLSGLADTGPSVVGIIRVNARSGKVAYAPMTGNDADAFFSAARAKFSNMITWFVSEAIVYSLDGKLVWGGPVDSSGIYQKIAFAPFGSTAAILADSVDEARADLRKSLGTLGSETSTNSMRELVLTVDRVQVVSRQGESFVEFTALETPQALYTGSAGNFPGLALTRSGDVVHIKVGKEQNGTSPLTGFESTKVLRTSR